MVRTIEKARLVKEMALKYTYKIKHSKMANLDRAHTHEHTHTHTHTHTHIHTHENPI